MPTSYDPKKKYPTSLTTTLAPTTASGIPITRPISGTVKQPAPAPKLPAAKLPSSAERYIKNPLEAAVPHSLGFLIHPERYRLTDPMGDSDVPNPQDQMQSLFNYLSGSDIKARQAPAFGQMNLGPPVDFQSLLGPYQSAIQGAYGGLTNLLNSQAAQAKSENAALRGRLAQSYTDATNTYNQASQGTQTGISDIANRLGMGQTLSGQGMQDLGTQDARIKGLAALQQAGSLGSFDTLANARGATFDVGKAMAAGSQASAISQLANSLASYQLQDELARTKAQQEYGLAGIQGQVGLQQGYNQARQNEIQNRMDMFKLQAQIAQMLGKPDPNAPTTSTTVTQNNPGLWDAIQNMGGGAGTYATKAFYEGGGDPEAALKSLATQLYGDEDAGITGALNLGPAENLGRNVAGTSNLQALLNPSVLFNTKPTTAEDLMAAMDIYRKYSGGTGASVKRSTTYKT